MLKDNRKIHTEEIKEDLLYVKFFNLFWSFKKIKLKAKVIKSTQKNNSYIKNLCFFSKNRKMINFLVVKNSNLSKVYVILESNSGVSALSWLYVNYIGYLKKLSKKLLKGAFTKKITTGITKTIKSKYYVKLI